MSSHVPPVSGAGAAPAAGAPAVVAAPAGVAAVSAVAAAGPAGGAAFLAAVAPGAALLPPPGAVGAAAFPPAGGAAAGGAAGAVSAGPRAADFDNPAVLAAGPTSNFGYHHGPIPNANHGWQPLRQRQALAANKRLPDVSVEDNDQAPNPMATLSRVNTLVCEIVVAPATNQMCGRVFDDAKKLHRHARTSHPGAVENPVARQGPVTPAEVQAGHDALKHHVLSLGWRNANFKSTSGFGQLRQFGSLVVGFADQCEEIARADPVFAGRFGTQFHRPGPVAAAPAGPAAGPITTTTTSSRAAVIGDDLTINGQLPATNLPLLRPRDSARAAAIRRFARDEIVGNNEEDDETYDEEAERELALKKAEAKEKRYKRAAVPVGEEEEESDEYYSDKETEKEKAKKEKAKKMARRRLEVARRSLLARRAEAARRAETPARVQRPRRFLGASQTRPFALEEEE